MLYVRRFSCRFALLAAVLLIASQRPASAQGLIWKLPTAEKFTVDYEGTYSQVDLPASTNSDKNNQKPTIDRKLTVKSLGREKAYYNGKLVDCRLLEFVVITGERVDGEIDPSSPGSRRAVKVLVPESAIAGGTHDKSGILFSMLPVATDQSGKKIYGLIKIGDAPPRELKYPVLQTYPLLTLLQHYRTLKQVPSAGALNIAGRQVAASQYTKYTATKVIESRSSRSTNTAEIIRSDTVPTGLASWKVTLVREEKNAAQARSEFKKVTTITTNMVCREVKMDATSELKKLR